MIFEQIIIPVFVVVIIYCKNFQAFRNRIHRMQPWILWPRTA